VLKARKTLAVFPNLVWVLYIFKSVCLFDKRNGSLPLSIFNNVFELVEIDFLPKEDLAQYFENGETLENFKVALGSLCGASLNK
jgi:hypothetical protein